MATGQLGNVLRHLRRAARLSNDETMTDGHLLECFHRERDEAAFEVLVRRHGPMVLGVCRRLLGNCHDAEDAFQATFLVLVRKAGSIVPREFVGHWLHGVAYRTALKARSLAARRGRRERQVQEMPDPAVAESHDWNDLRSVLDQELKLLREIYRVPVVLCELGGKSKKEVAQHLGVPEGTVSSRLARGRELLRKRLAKRGLTLSGAGVAAALAQGAAGACVPSPLVIATVNAATLIAAGEAAAGGMISAQVMTLMQGVLKALPLTKLKVTAIVLAALVFAGIGTGGLVYQTQASRSAGAQAGPQPKGQKQVDPRREPEALRQKKPGEDSVAVSGKVVDEQGAALGGIRVRLLIIPKPTVDTRTDSEGTFRFSLPDRRDYPRLLLAEDADGRRQGILRFRKVQDAQGLRLVLKPARATTVRVIDARGTPVGGARVAMFDASIMTLLTESTRDDGTAILRYPVEGAVGQLVAFKSGLGFDYYSTLIAKRGTDRRLLPDDVTLKLTGARTVRVKAVDSANRPVAGVSIYPWYVQKTGKPEHVNLSGCDAVRIVTDASGMAVFDWLPVDFEQAISFLSTSPEYSYVEQIWIKENAPAAELTMRLLRNSRISGKVRWPDGRPAAGIIVQATGTGAAMHNGRGEEFTRPDGSYEMFVKSEQAYIVTIVDDRWAAPSHVRIVVREDKPVGGLDFKLAVGTVVRGTVTLGPDRRPAAKEHLNIVMQAGEIPAELKKPGDTTYHEVSHYRGTATDAEGNYRFCLGPGKYQLRGPMHTEPKTITVAAEREIVHDFHMPRPMFGRLAGKVVDRDGKPVVDAAVHGVYMRSTGRLDIEATTAAAGTFEVERVLVPTIVYARTRDGISAGLTRIDFEQGQVTICVGPLAKAQGRLLNDQGEIVRGGRVRYGVRVPIGETTDSAFQSCFGGVATAAADGRYTLKSLIVGEEYHVSFEHNPDRGPWSQLTTVKPAKAETIELGDSRVRKLYRPPTVEEKTAQFFKRGGKLSERIAQAQAEAKRHYLRVVLIVGDAKDEKTRKLNHFREGITTIGQALGDYEQLAVAADDTAALAVLRETYALDAAKLKLPALIVLGENGNVLATDSSLMESKDADSAAAAIKEFLARHALPRLDAKQLLTGAKDRAAREGKRVFLQETGTGCHPCRVLSKFLDKHKAIFNQNYVVVEIDRRRFANGDEVMQRYRSGKDLSIPWCAILDAEGKLLANWDSPKGNIGFPSDATGVDYFLQVVAATAPRLTPVQLTDLRQALERKR